LKARDERAVDGTHLAADGRGRLEVENMALTMTVRPALGLYQRAPEFTLPSGDGRRISLRDFRQRRNLVLLLLHEPSCRACQAALREFASRLSDYRAAEAEIVAIVPGPVDRARQLAGSIGSPFPVLADETGEVFQRYTGRRPGEPGAPVASLFILDRFGQVYSQSLVQKESQLPSQQEVLDTLQFVEIQCPECGVAEWQWQRAM